MKYAKKICMENHYTLTCFIIRITGELLQTATLKGLVIIYHLSVGGAGAGVKGFAGGGLCWSHDYLIPLRAVLYIFMIPTLPPSFPIH